jgi:hypothetical protein
MRKKKSKMTLLEFLLGCKNKTDIISFDNPNDAYIYGKKVRDNIESANYDEEIIVDISGNTVRIKIITEESACVDSGCE